MTPPASGEELWHFRGLLATPDGTEVLTVKKSLNNNNCNETAALNLGRNAAADLLTQACGDFFDGYYKL